MTKAEAIEILDWIPTKGDEVDAMEMAIEALSIDIVRCKDCKYQDKGENECESWNLCGLRPWLHVPTSDEHFCSWGDRKDGEAE